MRNIYHIHLGAWGAGDVDACHGNSTGGKVETLVRIAYILPLSSPLLACCALPIARQLTVHRSSHHQASQLLVDANDQDTQIAFRKLLSSLL